MLTVDELEQAVELLELGEIAPPYCEQPGRVTPSPFPHQRHVVYAAHILLAMIEEAPWPQEEWVRARMLRVRVERVAGVPPIGGTCHAEGISPPEASRTLSSPA